MAEEETVDWGDVETTAMESTTRAGGGGDDDDVISLGGAEELEEEVSPPKAVVKDSSNGKADVKSAASAPAVEEPPAKVLPQGWKLQQARSGGAYYFNTVTGKTTWEFPSEDAGTPVIESATSTGEKLGGIQIKGAAKAAPSSDDDAQPASKKRDAVSQAKEEAVADDEIPQKRRRSNTPEKKRDTSSASPEPVQRSADPPRPRDSKPREDNQAASGWGRSRNIADESKMSSGQQDTRSRRYDNDTRGKGYNSRQNTDDRNNQRGHNGNFAAAPPTGKFVRPDNYRPAYDDRRPSARDDADKSNGRKRETSPVPRRREEYDRGDERETRREPRDRERDREPEERDRPRDYANKDVRNDRGRNDDDRRSETRGASKANDGRSDRTSGYQNQGYGNQNQGYGNQSQGYGGQGYNYMDRGGGPRAPRMPYSANDVSASTQTGNGPSRGYNARGYRPQSAVGDSSSPGAPFSPAGQGYGPRGMQPYPPGGGARPVRPWIAPEEKAKKWWNKNTGEKKHVDPIAAAEAEETERKNRRSSSIQSAEPAPIYKTDRERELAEREATIARKERELGLK